MIQRGKKIGQPLKPLTKKYTIARIDHHIVPLLGRKRIGDVSIADVEQFAVDVASGKTARDEKIGHRQRIIHPISDDIPEDQIFCLSLPFLMGRHPFIQGITSAHELGGVVGEKLAAAVGRCYDDDAALVERTAA